MPSGNADKQMKYWIEKYNAVKDGLNTATANKFAKADNLFSEYNMDNGS